MANKNPKTQTDVIASPKESLKSDVIASPIPPHVSEIDILISYVNASPSLPEFLHTAFGLILKEFSVKLIKSDMKFQ